jgi:sugar fermentation stimulation protein A
MSFISHGAVVQANFISRENRFIAFVKYNDEIIRCHLPNPGRMVELFNRDVKVWIRFHNKNNRKTKASLVAIELNDELIQLDTNLVFNLIPTAFEEGIIIGYEKFRVIKKEITLGNHRFDLLLSDGNREIVAEVKSTTRVVNNEACFPDAVSKRASSHVKTLTELKLQGTDTMIIFVVYRRANSFLPCHEIDPKFSKELMNAIKNNVSILILQAKSKIEQINKEDFISTDIIGVLPLKVETLF